MEIILVFVCIAGVIIMMIARRRPRRGNEVDAVKNINIRAVGLGVSYTSQYCAKCDFRFKDWYNFEKGYKTCPECESVNHLFDVMIVATDSCVRPEFDEVMKWKRGKKIKSTVRGDVESYGDVVR
jgi:hypothetical protein